MSCRLTRELSASEVEEFLDQHHGFIQQYYSTRTFQPSLLAMHSCQTSSIVSKFKAMSCQDVFESTEVKGCLGPAPLSSSIMSRENLVTVFRGRRDQKCETRVHYGNLDDKELLMELIRDISNELDVQRVSHKILLNIGLLTNADRCSLFLAQGSKDSRVLVSKLFDVTPESTLEESLCAPGEEITVPFGVGIAGYTAETGETINIKNAYQVV